MDYMIQNGCFRLIYKYNIDDIQIAIKINDIILLKQ